MDESVDWELYFVEGVRHNPDEQLVQTDLPPVHDAENLVQPAIGHEVDCVIPVNKCKKMVLKTSLIFFSANQNYVIKSA